MSCDVVFFRMNVQNGVFQDEDCCFFQDEFPILRWCHRQTILSIIIFNYKMMLLTTCIFTVNKLIYRKQREIHHAFDGLFIWRMSYNWRHTAKGHVSICWLKQCFVDYALGDTDSCASCSPKVKVFRSIWAHIWWNK